ncbi:MAG: DNA recombination protein RmuC, partial [Methanomassiliicoccales archaeon]
MEEFIAILIFVSGAVIGVLIGIAFFRQKMVEAEERGRLTASAEIAALNERIYQKDQQLLELEKVKNQNSELLQERSRLLEQVEAERKIANEKLALLEDAKQKMSDAFQALSSRALQENNRSFLETAKEVLERYNEIAKCDLESRKQAIDTLVKPIEEALRKVDEKLQQIETNRAEQYGMLNNGIQKLAEAQLRLQSETSKLVNALK